MTLKNTKISGESGMIIQLIKTRGNILENIIHMGNSDYTKRLEFLIGFCYLKQVTRGKHLIIEVQIYKLCFIKQYQTINTIDQIDILKTC